MLDVLASVGVVVVAVVVMCVRRIMFISQSTVNPAVLGVPPGPNTAN